MHQEKSSDSIPEKQEPIIPDGEDPGAREPKTRRIKPFNFWRGLQTTLGAAFVVATLFTLWTPGSLVESGLQARMEQVVNSALGEEESASIGVSDPADEERSNTIGIVSGHYGYDSGAVCANGTTERDMNLKIATLVQKRLSDQGYKVDLLEEFDSRLNGYQGAVLVSIHLDSCQYINEQATGYKVAAALSAQNAAANQRLTTCLSDRYGRVTGLPYHAGSVTDDMTYYHAFSEIDPDTVAAIIEAGFLNKDYEFITEKSDQMAEGIVAGILCYLNGEAIEPIQEP